ncbi:MAG: DNA polymerase Y family protein [Vicinamibacteraceae bacterium]
MDRLACVNVVALPLQLLLRAHPGWARLPVAVVEDDRPQAPVLFLNGPARRAGVRTGQRYATALALARDLRAGTVSPSQIDRDVRGLADRLRRYSPHVEPLSHTPGVFWLDARGLERLHPSLHTWAESIRADLQGVGLVATVAVGFSRFGVYALAVSHRDTVVCRDAAEERARVQQVPLARLDLDPDVRDRLLALGISTVGDFLRLPGSGIRARFGAATASLYRLAAGQQWAPLVPVPAEEPYERSVEFDAPENHVERLVFVVKRLLDALVAALAGQAQAVVAITLHMTLDDRATRAERVRPAAPTLDVPQLLTLIRLRLETLQLSAGIVALRVTAETSPATPDQCRLFAEQTRRNREAADQALARIRAECGDDSVVRARLIDAHLPPARFVWEPLAQVPARSMPRVVAVRPLVRRIFAAPGKMNRVPFRSRKGTRFIFGPYVMSGGWWHTPSRGGVHRDYYFVHVPGGELWWVYYDHVRQAWFLQGQVQ